MKLSLWLSYIAGMCGKVFNTLMSLMFVIIQSDLETIVSDRRRFPHLPNLTLYSLKWFVILRYRVFMLTELFPFLSRSSLSPASR